MNNVIKTGLKSGMIIGFLLVILYTLFSLMLFNMNPVLFLLSFILVILNFILLATPGILTSHTLFKANATTSKNIAIGGIISGLTSCIMGHIIILILLVFFIPQEFSPALEKNFSPLMTCLFAIIVFIINGFIFGMINGLSAFIYFIIRKNIQKKKVASVDQPEECKNEH